MLLHHFRCRGLKAHRSNRRYLGCCYFACINQTSIWETCTETDGTPCDEAVLTWLHSLDRHWLEFVANLHLRRLALTILDPDRSKIFSIHFVDNPYHGDH